jgi:hypothetical protein
MITTPADERFITDPALDGHIANDKIVVRVKAWASARVVSAVARLAGRTAAMTQIPQSNVWQVELERGTLADGVHPLTVDISDQDGKTAQDDIRLVLGASSYKPPQRSERDQDNAVGAWPDRGMMGTQLGPNKNGRKW